MSTKKPAKAQTAPQAPPDPGADPNVEALVAAAKVYGEICQRRDDALRVFQSLEAERVQAGTALDAARQALTASKPSK